MKNKLRVTYIIISIFFLGNSVFSQGNIDLNKINQIKVQNLSDEEILKLKNEIKKTNTSMEVLENHAISSGMTASDFQILKSRLELIPTANNTEKGTEIETNPIHLDINSQNNPTVFKSQIFGASLFSNPSLTFEPNSNMATPLNYVLGTGDELQIVIYGIQEFATNSAVSKEGKIAIPNVGQINVNGMTYEAATSLIKIKCRTVFSTLNSGQSNISVTLTKIRTINVTIIGANKPGNYSLSSLSTVFNALYLAGGPDGNGSYRNIELIRNNKIFKKIDVYKFLVNGDQSDNINLKDGDVIRIPVYDCRVSIEGEVKKSGIFELIPNENFNDLLRYCSGFSEAAYLSTISLVQNTDKELKIIDLSKNEYEKYQPKSGDVFKVGIILNRFENKISIKGAVFRPDNYALTNNLTLSSLINKADGLTEDAYKLSAQITRLKEDFTKEIISVNLNKVLSGDSLYDIKLKKDDEVYVFSLLDFKDALTVDINGEIRKGGTYAFVEKLTLFDLIIQSGGFTTIASKKIEISRPIIKDEVNKDQLELSKIITLEITNLDIEKAKDILLEPFDKIQVRKMPIYETQKSVLISGYVEYPGDYSISNKEERILDLITRAGGLKSEANPEGIYIKRGDRVIPINYNKLIKKPNSLSNIKMQPGDELVILKYVPAIRIIGSVAMNTEIPYEKGKNVNYYVNKAGGYTENSSKKQIFNNYPNKITSRTKNFIFFKIKPKVLPGTVINIPLKPVKEKKDIKEIIAIASLATSMTTMLAIVANMFK